MPAPIAESSPDCDVFVLGGGPGGSTIAALLAERGWNVVIAEKSWCSNAKNSPAFTSVNPCCP